MGSSSQQSNQQHFLSPFASLTLWLEAEGYPCPAGATTGGLSPSLPRGPNLLLHACPLSCGHTGPGRFGCLLQAWPLPVVKKSWLRKDNTCFRKCVETQHFSWTYPESPGGGPALWLECCLPRLALQAVSSAGRQWSHATVPAASFPQALPRRMIAPVLSVPLSALFCLTLADPHHCLLP